jgi:hypothetical protein
VERTITELVSGTLEPFKQEQGRSSGQEGPVVACRGAAAPRLLYKYCDWTTRAWRQWATFFTEC